MGNEININYILTRLLEKPNILGQFSIISTLIGLLITFLISLFIFYVYKKTYNGAAYSVNYNIALVLMALITSMVIMTISSNLVLSLGMVGALSIVRFRTAIKDPMDIVFMFWAIALGLTSGAGLYGVATIGSLFIGIITVLMVRFKNSNNVFMLIIHYQDENWQNLLDKLSEIDYKMKSKHISNGVVELTLEIKVMGDDTTFVEDISDTAGIIDVSLVSYNGNFLG